MKLSRKSCLIPLSLLRILLVNETYTFMKIQHDQKEICTPVTATINLFPHNTNLYHMLQTLKTNIFYFLTTPEV